MQINALPNPAFLFNTERPQLENNLVLHTRSREKYYYPDHATPYMFIANPNSRGKYVVNQQKLILSGNNFLFLNANDSLSISYDNDPVESIFILFEDNFVHQTYHALTADNETLLSHPFDKAPENNIIGSLPFTIDEQISLLFNAITCTSCDQVELDEKLLGLIGKIAKMKDWRTTEIDKIQAVKKVTRLELYRRLYWAREFMDEKFSQTRLNIDEIARIACLNKFHFILTFKQLFGSTPHQYLINIKLKKAYELIRSENYSITEVCYLTGFESLPSFSNSFKKKFGIVPSLLAKSKLPSIIQARTIS